MILSAGRVVEAKQHHLVIEALAIIPESHRPRLLIATPEALTRQEDHAYAARVVRMAEAAHVALEIRRNPSEDELVALYNKALMLVFVPIMEPFGLVALEAMACGVPVVGVREAGVRESVLHDRSGILVDRDATELARAIALLVEDPEMRRRQGRQAAEYVRNQWTWKQGLDRYEHQVAKLLERERIASTKGLENQVREAPPARL
jgi:glycosyltransferase involved in cell wall biosynthesis